MEAQRDEATGPGSHNWEEAQPEFKAKATGPQGLCGITTLDCHGIFVCFCPSALERQQGGGGRLDDPSENRYPPHPGCSSSIPGRCPPPTFMLTNAPQAMEPASCVREMTVEVWIRGAQEIEKHEELLGRERPGGISPTLCRPLPPSPEPSGGPGLTIAWILVGPGLWGADSMSWARCREP